MTNLASIDLGTHTTRLLIAQLKDNRFLKPLVNRRAITCLGMHIADSKQIPGEAMVEIIKVLEKYAQFMNAYKVKAYRAVATAALRTAKNAVYFISLVKRKLNLQIEIIDGLTEAHLTALGVLSTMDVTTFLAPSSSKAYSTGPVLIVDIGGGSTELIWLNGKSEMPLSLPVGAVSVTKGLSPLPSKEEIEKVYKKTREVILNKASFSHLPKRLIGTAGTVSTLAAIEKKMTVYNPSLINGCILTKESIWEILNKLAKLPSQQRLSIPGIEPGREEIILGGSIITLALLEVFSQNSLTVSEGGLLEGIIIDYLQKNMDLTNIYFILEDSAYGDKGGINI